MDYQELIYTVSNHVLTITFNKPDKLNAFGPQIEREFREALQRADADPDVRAIVITGAGRAFCVGADMGALTNASESGVPGKKVEPAGKTIEANYERRLTYMLRISKPMICAINGPVAGIGFSLTLFCDFRFMLDSANMSTSFARRGLIAEHGTSWMLQQLIGPMNALDLLMTARKITGAEADKMGLVRARPAETLMKDVYEFAQDIADNCSPRSTGIIKRLVYDAMFQNLAEALVVAETEELISFTSEDFKEGVAHFVQKRKPNFTGR